MCAIVSNLSFCVLLGSIYQEVANTFRVAPFVVVPRNQLDEGFVQHNTATCIEDGASRVADKVGGDHSIFGVSNDTFVPRGHGSLLQGVLDLLVGGRLREANDQVHNGNVNGRNTEGKTTEEERSKQRFR